MKNLPVQIKIVLLILFLVISAKTIDSIVNPGIKLYNTSKEIELKYNEISQTQITNYDGYYLAFTAKQENANINKETFIKVTEIIMSNRKDSQNLAWKWSQENQQIPYEEFTSFYKELSSFISERYFNNMEIEREKQSLVQSHSKLLQTFPNNLYNKFIHIHPLTYKQGFVTNKTKQLFK